MRGLTAEERVILRRSFPNTHTRGMDERERGLCEALEARKLLHSFTVIVGVTPRRMVLRYEITPLGRIAFDNCTVTGTPAIP